MDALFEIRKTFVFLLLLITFKLSSQCLPEHSNKDTAGASPKRIPVSGKGNPGVALQEPSHPKPWKNPWWYPSKSYYYTVNPYKGYPPRRTTRKPYRGMPTRPPWWVDSDTTPRTRGPVTIWTPTPLPEWRFTTTTKRPTTRTPWWLTSTIETKRTTTIRSTERPWWERISTTSRPTLFTPRPWWERFANWTTTAVTQSPTRTTTSSTTTTSTTTTTTAPTTTTTKPTSTTTESEQDLGEWTEWSDCREAEIQQCPQWETRDFLCSSTTPCEPRTEKRACYSNCIDVYKHDRFDGYCEGIPTAYIMRYISDPNVCADSCNLTPECYGFTYDGENRKCYITKSPVCGPETVKQDKLQTTYLKQVPDNYECGQSECTDGELDDNLLERSEIAVQTWLDCAEVCNTNPACRSFQWGNSPQMFIKNDDEYLPCLTFISKQCSSYVANLQSRYCWKKDI